MQQLTVVASASAGFVSGSADWTSRFIETLHELGHGMDAECDGDVYLWACSMFATHSHRDPVIVAHESMSGLAEESSQHSAVD